jgi:hypothetical protein
MAEVAKRELIILNLAGELSVELKQYFAQKKATLLSSDDIGKTESFSHILTRGEMDFFDLSSLYNTIDRNIKIISLTALDDIQQFVMANGKLIIDEVWFSNGFGHFIMDKFFQDIGGINLGDSYPVFTEKGSFNIANPFNTGEYLDRMVHTAFQDGMSGLSIKTFFDHLIMYLTGLKTKGKVGLPIEVTYGYFEDVFGIQLHFFTQDLILEDLTLSLASNISKKAEEYLLNVAVHSSDFFDLTYLHDVNKAVITGLWTRDSKIKIENRGLLISDLSAGAAITQYPIQGVTSFLSGNSEISDLSDKIILPTTIVENKEIEAIKGSTLKDSHSQSIAGVYDLENEVTIVKGSLEETADSQTIRGGTPLSDEITLVKGSREEELEVIKVKGEASEGEERNLVKGGQAEREQKTVIQASREKTETAMQVIKGDAPIKPSAFMVKKMGEGLQGEENGKADSPLRRLVNLVKASEEESEVGENDFAKQKLKQDRAKIQEILKVKSHKDELPEEIKNNFDAFLAAQDKSVANATQKDFEAFKKTEIQKTIKSAANSVERTLGASPGTADKRGDKLVQTLQAENESLKSKMKTLLAEVKILKESKGQLAEIHQKAMEAAEISTQQQQSDHLDNILREQMLQKLKDQKGLGEQDSKRLFELMERENKFIQNTKEQEAKLRKLHIEAAQKESYFSREIEKLQRQVKAKEMIVTKAKENVTIILEKKDQEIAFLNQKLTLANKTISAHNPQAQNQLIKDLEKQLSNHEKMIEIYKNQMSNRPVDKLDDEQVKEENRRLQMINKQFKNQLDLTKKDFQKLQDRSAQDTALILTLKADKLKLEQSLKKASMEVRKEEISNNAQPALEAEVRKLKGLNDFYEGQIKDAQARQREQEVKLQAALKNQKKDTATEEASGKGRTGQLENNIRKLTQDLVESRNLMAEMKKETTKLRQEKIAFQNQIDKFKKDAEKAKGAAPKKPGAGGKAA